MRKKGLVFVVLLLTVMSTSAQAQYSKNNQSRNSKPKQSGSASSQPVPFKKGATKTMEKDISIPDVPVFPGAKFFSGQQAVPSNTVISGYTVEYKIPNSTPDQVVSFYQNVFNGGGWKISQQTPRSIDAHNPTNNSFCNVFVDGGEKKRGKLHINYVITAKNTNSGAGAL